MAVELGAGLTEVARANVAEFPNAEVVTADVEKWDSPVAGFDLVVCATAFHWLDPDTRLARLARWLRPGGVVALIQTFHIAGRSDAFFGAAQRCYQRWDPATTDDVQLPRGWTKYHPPASKVSRTPPSSPPPRCTALPESVEGPTDGGATQHVPPRRW